MLAVAGLFLFSSCKKDSLSIVGKWEDVTQAKQEGGMYNVYTFEKDGSYKLQGFWVSTNEEHKGMKGTYTFSGKELKLIPENGLETIYTVTSLTASEMVWQSGNYESRLKRITE